MIFISVDLPGAVDADDADLRVRRTTARCSRTPSAARISLGEALHRKMYARVERHGRRPFCRENEARIAMPGANVERSGGVSAVKAAKVRERRYVVAEKRFVGR
jgi:hypothetical protein